MRVFRASLALGLAASLAAATGAFAGNLPDSLAAPVAAPEAVVLGSIQTLSVDRCVLSFSVQATAEALGGEDAFRLEIYDDGALVRVAPLSIPADGAVHTVAGTVELPLVSQAVPGIGVVLADDQLLDLEDPFPATCVPTEVPTLGRAGLAGLGALLGLAAIAVVRRRGRGAA
jgi:hypothetical protein